MKKKHYVNNLVYYRRMFKNYKLKKENKIFIFKTLKDSLY